MRRAAVAVCGVFLANGVLFSSWTSRLPAIRDDLHLSSGRLGVVLLIGAFGALLALGTAGVAVRALGQSRAILLAAAVAVLGLATLGWSGSAVHLVVALLVMGAGIGVWDVAMNVAAGAVERCQRRPIMSWFHAAFSVGTVIGALVGAAAAAATVPVRWHLLAIGAITCLLVAVAVPGLLPEPTAPLAARRPLRAVLAGQLAAWREPITVLIGLMMLGMALAEGAANDWLALALVDGYHADHAQAALGLGVFVVGMTAMRVAGPILLARFPAVLVMRGCALLVVLSTLALAASSGRVHGPAAAALTGICALLWGVGVALGFPVGISAAGVSSEHAAARVGVVSTIAYTAFIAGPGVIGVLAEQLGTSRALVAVAAAAGLTAGTAGVLRSRSASVPT